MVKRPGELRYGGQLMLSVYGLRGEELVPSRVMSDVGPVTGGGPVFVTTEHGSGPVDPAALLVAVSEV